MKKVLIGAVIVLIALFVFIYSASDSALLEKFQDNLNAILPLGHEERFEIISEREALKRFPEEVVRVAKAWVIAGGFPDYPAYRHPGQPDDVNLPRHMMVKKGSSVLWVGVSYNLTSGFKENVKLVPQYGVGVDFGKLIERMNETDYRVTAVYYDDLFTRKYLTVDFNVSAKPDSGYVIKNSVGDIDSGYYEAVYVPNGRWQAGNYSGPLDMFVYTDPNEKDNEIICTIAEQIGKFANENGLNNSQVVILTAWIVDIILVHKNWGVVYIYEDEKFRPSTINVTDSRMVEDVLEGTVCRGFAEWTAAILGERSIRAFEYAYYPRDGNHTTLHARVGVVADDIDLDYLKSFSFEEDLAVVNATVNSLTLSYAVLEPFQREGFQDIVGVTNSYFGADRKNCLCYYIHGPNSAKLYLDLLKI